VAEEVAGKDKVVGRSFTRIFKSKKLSCEETTSVPTVGL
jgi:hypothetical protein